MKKFITSATSVVLGTLPFVALAQSSLPNNGGFDELNGNVSLGNKPLISTIGSIINVLLGFLGVIAVILILVGGFKWMTAAGNEEKVAEAKKLLGGGVIGLVIILAAFAIAAFVVGQLSNATY